MSNATLIEAKLDDIHTNPLNPRKDLGDLNGLAESIKSVGLLQPVIVTKDDTGLRLQAGERRTAAARAAGLDTIPAIVIDDKEDLETILNALVENIQREDLTPLERAAGYQAALDLGLTPTTLSKRTGDSLKTVKRHLEVIGLAASTKDAIQAYTVTLDEGVALLPLEGYPDLYKAALKKAGTSDFKYTVERALAEIAYANTVDKTKADCESKGIRYVTPDETQKYRRVEWLSKEAQKGHDALDCHAIGVSPHGAHEVFAYCMKPNRHDPTRKADKNDVSPEAVEERRKERRQVIESNKACTAANTVRRAWIDEFLTRKKLDRMVIVYAAEVLANRGLDRADANDVIRKLAGDNENTYWVSTEQVAAATGDPDKALRFLLAAALKTAEKNIDNGFWRTSGDNFAAHLRGLMTFGYEPCEPEVEFLKKYPTGDKNKK